MQSGSEKLDRKFLREIEAELESVKRMLPEILAQEAGCSHGLLQQFEDEMKAISDLLKIH